MPTVSVLEQRTIAQRTETFPWLHTHVGVPPQLAPINQSQQSCSLAIPHSNAAADSGRYSDRSSGVFGVMAQSSGWCPRSCNCAEIRGRSELPSAELRHKCAIQRGCWRYFDGVPRGERPARRLSIGVGLCPLARALSMPAVHQVTAADVCIKLQKTRASCAQFDARNTWGQNCTPLRGQRRKPIDNHW